MAAPSRWGTAVCPSRCPPIPPAACVAGTAGQDGVQHPSLSQNLPAPLLFSLLFSFFFSPPRLHPSQHPLPHPSPPVQRHPLPSQPTNLGDQPRLPASPRPQKATLKGSGQPLRAPLRGGGGPGAARHEAAPPRLAPPRPRSAALPEPPLGTCMEPTHLQAGQGQGEDEGQEHAEIHPGFRPRRLRAHGRRAPARQGRAAS